jgi:hypothetical protein
LLWQQAKDSEEVAEGGYKRVKVCLIFSSGGKVWIFKGRKKSLKCHLTNLPRRIIKVTSITRDEWDLRQRWECKE